MFFVAVCYVPPVSSSRDVDVAERFLLLEEQIHRFQAEGQVVLCGDLIARCGGLQIWMMKLWTGVVWTW